MLSEILFRAGFGGLIGATLASFAAAAAFRIAADQNPLFGGSACDHCATRLGWRDTVPVLSFIARRGRCRACEAAIRPAYLGCEVSGAAAGAVTLALAPVWTWAPLLILMALLIHAAAYDLLTLRIRDAVSLAAALTAGLQSNSQGELVSHLATAAVVFAVLGASMWSYRHVRGRPGLGFGDVKLVAALSLATGPGLTALALAAACGLAWAWLIWRRPSVGEPLPFAPFIALAFWPIVFGGTIT